VLLKPVTFDMLVPSCVWWAKNLICFTTHVLFLCIFSVYFNINRLRMLGKPGNGQIYHVTTIFLFLFSSSSRSLLFFSPLANIDSLPGSCAPASEHLTA
jgi:hypothetical protein